MPRRRSSAHRSGSIPVSARTSVDLPWSTWPAVATTDASAAAAAPRAPPRATRGRRHVGGHAAQVEQAAGRARPARPRGGSPGAQRRGAAPAGSATAQPGSSTPGAPPPPTAAVARRPPSPTSRARPAPRSARAQRGRVGVQRSRRSGWPGPRRVASSAARVSLSTRSARASGCRRSRSTTSARPSSSPACGPPSSLSPLRGDQGGAGPQGGRGVRLVGQQRVRARAARSRCRRPRGTPERRPAPRRRPRAVNPLDPEVATGAP